MGSNYKIILTPSQLAHIKNRYEHDRATAAVISRELENISPQIVLRALKDLGIKRYKGGRRRGQYPVNAKGYKKCVDCGETNLAETHFFPAKVSSDGYTVRCKSCHQKMNRHLKLKREFGLTLAEYDILLENQKGVCAICGMAETRQVRHQKIYHLAVDHDHATGKLRGLLCSRCNKLLGALNDDIGICKAIIAYLTHWRKQHNAP
jgi:hypothetical protein